MATFNEFYRKKYGKPEPEAVKSKTEAKPKKPAAKRPKTAKKKESK